VELAFRKWQEEQRNTRGVPVYTIGNNGLTQVGAVPKGSKVVTPNTMISPQEASDIKSKSQTQTMVDKKARQSQMDFDIARNKLMTTAGAFKAMAEKAGGAGRGAGIKNLLTGATGENPYVKPFQGQLVEAAAALAKLAAPSARVGQEIIAQFKKTLPTQFSNMDEFASQIRFSLHNAYATALANNGKIYTPEIRQQVESMVDEILNVPPMNVDSLNVLKSGGKIQTFVVKGQTYYIPEKDAAEFKKDMGIK